MLSSPRPRKPRRSYRYIAPCSCSSPRGACVCPAFRAKELCERPVNSPDQCLPLDRKSWSCLVPGWKSAQCFSFALLRIHALLWRVNILDQAETIGPVRTLVLHDVHALLNEMQPKPARLYLFQGAHAHLVRLYGWSAIAQQDLQTSGSILIGLSLNSAEEQFDRPVWPSGIGVPDDICKSFVDGPRYRPALLGGEPEGFRQALHGAAHRTEQARIARQLQPQQQTPI